MDGDAAGFAQQQNACAAGLKNEDWEMRKKKRTGNASLMIRMIDVVFILLFGFIAVSQITTAGAIDPPKSKEAEFTAPDGPSVIIVGINKAGECAVDNGARVFKKLGELETYLAETATKIKQKTGRELTIRIRANWDAPIPVCMRTARLCQNLGIAKGIDVIRVQN